MKGKDTVGTNASDEDTFLSHPQKREPKESSLASQRWHLQCGALKHETNFIFVFFLQHHHYLISAKKKKKKRMAVITTRCLLEFISAGSAWENLAGWETTERHVKNILGSK